MARCGTCQGLTTECCNFSGGDCISISGSGSVADPVLIAPIIDPDGANQLECRDDGLFVAGGALGTLTDGYAEKTSEQTGISDADITGLTVTVSVVAGRRYKVTGYCSSIHTASVNLDVFELRIQEGGTVRQAASARVPATGGNVNDFLAPLYVFVAAATASRTFKLRLTRTSGTGTVVFAASATAPGFILVEDIGI